MKYKNNLIDPHLEIWPLDIEERRSFAPREELRVPEDITLLRQDMAIPTSTASEPRVSKDSSSLQISTLKTRCIENTGKLSKMQVVKMKSKSNFFCRIRNIEVPHHEFSSSPSPQPPRPSTAPAPRSKRPTSSRRRRRPRSPSHPNYKEDAYLLTHVRLQYVGHSDLVSRNESRARHRAHRRKKRLPPIPDHMDEVTIVQQPRGSYVLEVFHGFLSVGGE